MGEDENALQAGQSQAGQSLAGGEYSLQSLEMVYRWKTKGRGIARLLNALRGSGESKPTALRPYWFVLCVLLHQPLRGEPDSDDEDDRARELIGYHTCYGVTAEAASEARRLVEEAVQDGTIDWSDSEVSRVDPQRLHRNIRARSKNWTVRGIWYRAGRALWTAEGETKRTSSETSSEPH